MKKLNQDYKEPDYGDVILESKKIICKKCGSKEWIVGRGDYYTAIKCPKCLYELCIHEG